jgi:hypothetical protein
LLPAAELLSFLKQTHGTWTERDLSKALNVSPAEAKQAIGAMQLQGYAEPIARTQKWRTTEAGLAVSGAKTARLTRKAVEEALSALRDRIQATNNDKNADTQSLKPWPLETFSRRTHEFSLPRSVFGLRGERLMSMPLRQQWNIRLKKHSSSSFEVKVPRSTSKTTNRG